MVDNTNNEITFEILSRAVTGDEEAISTIMTYYRPIIRKMATKRLYDGYGNVYKGVDEALCRRLEAKLMLGILKFRIQDEPN